MERLGAQLITDIDLLGPFEAGWRSLAEDRSNAFVTPEWFHSWWQFDDHSSPLISVVHRADGSLAGVMPLVLDSSSRPRAVRFAGASLGDCFHPAAAIDDEVEVAAATMRALEAAGLDRKMILLEHSSADRPWWKRMQRRSPHSPKYAIVEQQRSDVSFIDLDGLDWDGYLGQRSKGFRKQVRRAERSLVANHDMTVRQATPATLEDDLDQLFYLHDLRLGSRGGSSLGGLARSSLRSFAASALDHGWLRLSLMLADGAPVSAVLSWRVGTVVASYQGGFDPSWSKQSVGFAHEAINVRSAIEEGAAEYDFLLGCEDWKRRFSDINRPCQTTVLLRARRPMRVLVAAESRARRAGAGLAKWEHTRGAVRTMHSLIPTARRSS